MREHLLGYLLRALDDPEHEQVEDALRHDPELQRELESLHGCLDPLCCDDAFYEAPRGLAERTCAAIFGESASCAAAVSVAASTAGLVATVNQQPRPTDAQLAPGGAVRRAWQLLDAVVASGVVAAAALLFFPALIQSRRSADLAGCQYNMNRIDRGLGAYASLFGNLLPQVPQSGNMAVAGSYAVKLHENGFIRDPRVFVCPSSSLARTGDVFRVPSQVEVFAARGEALRQLQARMGGSYGYTLGHVVRRQRDGREIVEVSAPRYLGRSGVAVLADAQDPTSEFQNSCNHGGCGQNVLFEDGHVAYLTSRRLPSVDGRVDDIFANDLGQLAPGVDELDSVLGHSAASPAIHSAELKDY